MPLPGQARFIQTQEGTVNANGTVSIVFNPAPLGKALTGTITVVNSDNGISWTVAASGQAMTTVLGQNPIAGIQVFDGDSITVSANNLVPGNTYMATFVGVSENSTTAEIVYPSSPTQQTTQGGNSRVVISGQQIFTSPTIFPVITANLLPTERSVVILMEYVSGTTGATISAITQGLATNTFYDEGSSTPETIFGGLVAKYPAIALPAYGAVDNQIQIVFKGSAGITVNVWVIALPDELIGGTPTNPENVILVGPTGIQQGTSSAPLVVAHSISLGETGGGINLTTAFQKILSTPATGNVRVATAVSFRGFGANSAVAFSFDGVNTHFEIDVATANTGNPPQFITPNWRIRPTDRGIWVLNITSANGQVWMTHRDEVTNG